MAQKYLDLRSDFAFKRIFGSENNKANLIALLNDILLEPKDKIIDLQYGKLQRLGQRAEERQASFDLYCTNQNGEHIIIEMQVERQRFYLDRSLYYTSTLIQSLAKKGAWDFELPKIYSIHFLNFALDHPSTKADLRIDSLLHIKQQRELLYDKLQFTYLQLSNAVWPPRTELEGWVYLIANLHKMSEIDLYYRENPKFMRVIEDTEYAKLSPEERRAYESQLKQLRDYHNQLTYREELGFEKGIEIGTEKGIEIGTEKGIEIGTEKGIDIGEHRKSVATATKALKKGLAIELIHELTGLSIEEIKELAEKLKKGEL